MCLTKLCSRIGWPQFQISKCEFCWVIGTINLGVLGISSLITCLVMVDCNLLEVIVKLLLRGLVQWGGGQV